MKTRVCNDWKPSGICVYRVLDYSKTLDSAWEGREGAPARDEDQPVKEGGQPTVACFI